MGMTIDNAITWLNTDDFESKGFADATSVAIDTMRKYQKIEKIIEEWSVDNGAFAMSESYWLNTIRKVIEDDNT